MYLVGWYSPPQHGVFPAADWWGLHLLVESTVLPQNSAHSYWES